MKKLKEGKWSEGASKQKRKANSTSEPPKNFFKMPLASDTAI